MCQGSMLRHRYTRRANATVCPELQLVEQMVSPRWSHSCVTDKADTFVAGNREEFIHLGGTVWSVALRSGLGLAAGFVCDARAIKEQA